MDDYLRDPPGAKDEIKRKKGHKRRRRKKSKKGKKKALKIILIIFVIVLLILLGCVAGFFYLSARGEKSLKKNGSIASEAVKGTEEEQGEVGTFLSYKGKRYKYNEDVINFLCLGIDKEIAMNEKRDTGSEGLSDAIILVSLNTETSTLKIIAVPRETIVPVKVFDKSGKFTKTENKQITLQYAYGKTAEDSCELMTDCVSKLLYQLPIQRYCSINFQALPVLNDAIGGVDLTSLETVEWWNGIFYEGEQLHLEGQTALDYVRQRDESVPESSMGRLERQKQYITCYIEQAKEAVKQDMGLPVTLFKGLSENMCTNITVEDITYLVPKLLNVSLTAENIGMIPGEVTNNGEYEEYHVSVDLLKELVISSFYEEVPAEDITNTSEKEKSSGEKEDSEKESDSKSDKEKGK